jgi:dihydroorotase
VGALTIGPAGVLGSTAGGAAAPGLVEGRAADIVILDRSDRWTVEPMALRSKGYGNPLGGRSLPGRVLATIAAGRVAYADGERR